MNKENNNYSPISVIDNEQLILRKRIEYTHFSSLGNNVICHKQFLIKSNPCKGAGNSDLYCLFGMEIMEEYEFHFKKTEELFGIIPTIPYKYVSKIAKLNDNGLYELGHYPQSEFNQYLFADYLAAGILKNKKIKNEKSFEELSREISKDIFNFECSRNFRKSKYIEAVSEEYFSVPKIVRGKVTIKNYDVYRIMDIDGNETKAIIYDWLVEIEPVEWIKYGEYLVCTKILFNCPVHMKNDYVKNKDVQSFDDTFLKWYIDNVFFRDLFKYTDLTFMKEQMPLAIDEDIDTKLKEIEKLKQIKANLILQQQSEEHIIDTAAQRNISNLFENENKDETVRTVHK